jgi:LmbE family N-acetylglucosaminyl deacetylase
VRRPVPSAGGRPARSAPFRALAAAALATLLAPLAAAQDAGSAILQDLRGFRETGSVLYVAAHPDDENTQLITYLSRGRGYRTAYLSLTRGDGGQNLLGPEFGDALGVIRTQELLAARRIDGGSQYFSRAKDFGFSKDYRQTLSKWDRQQVLADVVRVIRTFRPDVVITRFPTEPGNTHGHHTASAILAVEAFGLAGDPRAFPEQLDRLSPWQPRRILWNAYNPGAGGDADPSVIHMAIDGADPVSGLSFATMAARSRSMHQTQGFANFSVAAGAKGPKVESFRVLAGEPAAADIMDGVDTSWSRVRGGPEVGRLTDQAIAGFDAKNPAATVPALLEIRKRLAELDTDPLVARKGLELDRILQACLGLSVETVVGHAEVVPGETLHLHHSATVAFSVPVRWIGVRYPGIGPDAAHAVELRPNARAEFYVARVLPTGTPLTQPYWLRREGTPGMFRVDDASLIGLPENPPAVPIEDVFAVGGQTLVVRDEAVQVTADPARGPVRTRLEVIAPVSLAFASPVQLFAPGSSAEVSVGVTAAQAAVSGSLGLEAPEGWLVSPASQRFKLASPGSHAALVFTVTAPKASSSGAVLASAAVGTARYGVGRALIDYKHIPAQLLQAPARLRVVALDLAIRGKSVGYLPGAGDSVAASLGQMGYDVTTLADADLTADGLRRFDAVVVGVRAFNTRAALATQAPALFAYVESGGTVVEQYNTPNGLKTDQLAPFPLKLSRDLPKFRVTDENAPVTLLAPGHPALAGPNRIGPADFEGWVQERGLDFASEWDEAHFTALLACGDAGEPPLRSGLLVARYGRGYIVYTGLSFFRQLPAGVPGAYRLFANLVSLGR